MHYDVEYYEKTDGSRPAEDFILSQDAKMQAKIFATLELLELKGSGLREPFSKPLGMAFLRFGQNRVRISAVCCISLWWAVRLF